MHFHPPARSGSSIDLRPETEAFLASQCVDVNAALRDISQRARALTGATGVAIALAHKQSMICRASVGHAPSLGSRLDITSGFSGECVRTGGALLCHDSELDPRVDLESCRRLGIRSILAIPIRGGNEVVGLLEVFSQKPSAFSDWHIGVLKRLVNSPLPSDVALTSTSPEFPLGVDPANNLFADKPVEVFTPAPTAAINLPSLPAQFWSDVFVPDALPWKRFAQSLGLHIVMIAALAGFVRLALHGPHAVQPKFNASDVLYYSSSEYFGRKAQKLRAARVRPRFAELPDERIIPVPKERSRRTQEFVPAPDVKLKADIRGLPVTGWSAVSPSIPASAIMRKQFVTPTAPVSVVAPPPDLSSVGTRHGAAGPGTAVIEPPPSIKAAPRQVADLTIGALQVVSPPPEISYGDPNSKALAKQARLHDDLTTVIAPSPSLDGLHLPSAQGRGGEVGAGHIVPPPPQISGTSKRGRQATLGNDLASVIGPSPSLEGIGGTGPQGRGSVAIGAAQVVPPPPQISGAGGSRTWTPASPETAVVSPPPSTADLGAATGGYVSTRRAGGPTTVPLPPTTESANNVGKVDTKSNVLPPMDANIGDDKPRTDRKELDIAPLAPAGALASSSYFASSEIFIAQERLGAHQKRYIKLVYDYLPYQKRLSEYGPNYPQVDKLRATRDLTCDENLTAAAYSIAQAEVSRSSGSPAQPQDAVMYQDRLPCFRTTADDYRRALDHRSKSRSAR